MDYIGCRDMDCAAHDAYSYNSFDNSAKKEAIEAWNTRAPVEVDLEDLTAQLNSKCDVPDVDLRWVTDHLIEIGIIREKD